MTAHLAPDPKRDISSWTDSGSSTACSSSSAARASLAEKEAIDDLRCGLRKINTGKKEDLVWRFACMINSTSARLPDGAFTTANLEEDLLTRKVLQSVRLLRSCKYDMEEVTLTLAYASVYFKHIFASLGDKVSDSESVYICILLIYLAHSYIFDETCPLNIWQRYIFKKYSSVKTLNRALFRLLKLREFRLRILDSEEREALDTLLGVASAKHETFSEQRV